MKKLKIWREGALAHMRGDAFSMTPYPTPRPTDLSWDNEPWKRAVWASGWWWAAKHRPFQRVIQPPHPSRRVSDMALRAA